MSAINTETEAGELLQVQSQLWYITKSTHPPNQNKTNVQALRWRTPNSTLKKKRRANLCWVQDQPGLHSSRPARVTYWDCIKTKPKILELHLLLFVCNTFVLFFRHRLSLCSPGWPRPSSVDQVGLELRIRLPLQVSRVCDDTRLYTRF